MELLENLNNLDGVDGFMNFDEEEESDDERKSSPPGDDNASTFEVVTNDCSSIFQSSPSGSSTDNWGDDINAEEQVFNNLEIYELKVIVYEGRNIPWMDFNGLRPSDPQINVTLFDGKREEGVHHQMKQTTIVHNSDTPKWGVPSATSTEEDKIKQEMNRSKNRGSSFGEGIKEQEKGMDLTLIGEEMHMETTMKEATLFVQCFDDDDDENDLIGSIEINLDDYLNSQTSKQHGQWYTLKNSKINNLKGEIRMKIIFQQRDLGPSSIRKLTTSLNSIMTMKKYGLVR